MAYLVVAYPEIGQNNFDLIQSYRKENDELYYSVAEPHFTIVFPVFDFSESLFLEEIADRVKNIDRINFVIRCASINKDTFSEYFHTFLVPDEGNSKIVKAHDKLYSGQLKDNLRLDIDFIPHIGIGNSKDKLHCKQMVDKWNETDFEIAGIISSLTIIKYETNIVTRLKEINLK